MKNKSNNQEAYFERMRELAAVNKQVIKESRSTSTLLEYKKAGDGRIYGIVKENQAYFIKTAQAKKNISEADFAYIGGLSNITEYKCHSLTEAQRVLNTKVMTVNETYGGMYEAEDDEQMQQQAPAPAPEPQPQAEPAPAPAPEPAPEPQAEPEQEEAKDPIHSAISKAAEMFSGANIEAPKVEYYLKQFLGVIEKSQLSKLDDNQKEVIFDEYFNSEEAEPEADEFQEGYLNEEDIFDNAETVDGDEYDDEDELEIDAPEMEDNVNISGMNPSLGGGKEVDIDLNAGTIKVSLPESKVRQLAKKYNVSESYIKWKMNDIMQEEVETIEKEKLKEQRVRKVVRNIIKEKLGLKKKPLRESVSKERLKLEKLVESVLKKNM
jgi:hypothetical protein